MSTLSKMRIMFKKFGIEINRFNASQSQAARTGLQFASHGVDCVIDVGANDGGYGEFIRSTGFKGNIVSFEPQVVAHQKLIIKSRNDKLWHIPPPMALGEIESELEINVAGNSTSSSILRMLPSHILSAPESRFIGKEKVIIHRLDKIDHLVINSSKRIYLKIDTQGYEMSVLEGSQGIMNKVEGVQLEMSVIPLYEGQVIYQDLLSWLTKAGFELWGVEPGFMDKATGRMLQFDGIFFKKKNHSKTSVDLNDA